MAYQNLDLFRIHQPRFIPYAKTYIYTVFQNPDLYRIPKPRFTPYIKSYIYIVD